MEVRKVRVLDNLPFLVADEAMRMNEVTRQNMKVIAFNMQQRARIETNYVNNLREWARELGKDDKGKAMQRDRVWDYIMATMKDDAFTQAEMHEDVSNQITDMNGPATVLENQPVPGGGSESVLNELMKKYSDLVERRTALEDEMRKTCSDEFHCQKLINELGRKLSSTSRITAKKSDGTKKVNMMRDRLSKLREQAQKDAGTIEQLHKEMDDFQEESYKELEQLAKEFGECVKCCIRYVAEQIRQYEQALSPISSKKKPSDLDDDTIDNLMVESWTQDIIMKAKARKAGQVATLEEMFKSLQKNALNQESMPRSRASSSSSKKRHVHIFPRFRSKNQGEDDMSVQSINCGDSEDSNISAKTNNHCTSSDSDHLETILIPHENRSIFPKGRPFPTREFCPTNVTDKDDDALCPRRDFTLKHDFAWKAGRLVDGSDLGLMREIRVQAVEDYKAVHPTQISLKKGQIIKQKAGADEDGYCYGWTRDGKLSSKSYGRYPKQAVTIYRSDTPFPSSILREYVLRKTPSVAN